MVRRSNALCFLFLFHSLTFVESFWGWFGGRESSTKAIDHSMGSNLGKLANVPFEMRTKDEKFLLEAEKFGLVLSNLDICHHKVILHLKKSCSAMTEEEIAKMSVHLFNCQSAVEGRQTFPCTDEMTLAECTHDMDKSTWNAYHIMSNRARAVCYATRQQEFVVKTEMAVNKLMYTADHQIQSLEKIEEGQVKVKELSSQTLETMQAGQQELVERQEKLKASQQTIQTFVTGNLRELTREKSLIAAGQKELAHMTELIQQKLDEASMKLNTNEIERQNNHQEILNDLSMVQEKAKEMWEKIDRSTQNILKQHAETAHYYQGTIQNLEKINETVSYLLQLVDQTRTEVDAKLGWLSGILDGAGLKLAVIYCCVVHGLYFLVAATVATFLQIPSFSRIFMSFIIPINALCDASHMTCLDFSSLTVVVVTTILAHWLASMLVHRKRLGGTSVFKAITDKVKSLTPTRISITHERQQSNGNYPGLGVAGARELNLPSDEISSTTDSIFDLSHASPNSENPGSSTPLTPRLQSFEDFQSNSQHVRRDLLPILDNGRATRSRSVTPNRTLTSPSSRSSTPNRTLTSPSSRSSTPRRSLGGPSTSGLSQVSSPKKFCSGFKKSGSPCRSVTSFGTDYCYRHVNSPE